MDALNEKRLVAEGDERLRLREALDALENHRQVADWVSELTAVHMATNPRDGHFTAGARRWRRRAEAFPEIVVLTHLILNPPTAAPDPKELYLATTAELSRRFARIYTTLGTQDPLYRRFCLYRDRDFRKSQIA
ncbi:hypothetical protein V1460_06240 [Streptomyces sp. SCSIO 30461]|uniref:hypothetical protein n=1 Tax=Streptomyces sp. SCSIO 30461 TaxID=3118085 RepID=UPI0030D277C8